MNTEEEKKDTVVAKMKPVALIATYGTLRNNEGNWRYLLKGKSDLLGTYKTEAAYTMYGKRSGYPVVVDKGNTEIEYDLFAVYEEEVLKDVDSLEGCHYPPNHPNNHFYDCTFIETPHGKAKMYIMHNEMNEDSIIHSGNWLKRHAE